MSFTIQLRRGLAATWTSENPVLAQGEIGLETDTFLAKVGDGATVWTGLSYWNPNGGSGGGGGAVSSVFGRTGAVTAHSGDYSVGQVTGAAPLASPALTGTPTAPTASALTNSTQLATTAYTDSAVAVEKARAQATEALLSAGIYNVKASPYNATGNGSTDDTAAINAALLACHNAGGGTVVAPPGTYLISAPLVIYSNTLLQSSRDTVFTLAAASNCNMIANFACTPNRSVSDAAITTGTATLTSATAAFVSGDVGATVAVAGANQAGQVLTANIVSVTNGTTVVLDTNAQNTVTAAACSIYYRDSNIEISGGTWNRNNNGYTAGGAANQNTTQLRFLDGLYVHDMSLSAGTVNGYQLAMAAVTNFVVKRITVFAPSTTPNTDGVSVVGPAYRGVIDTVFGSDGDDLIALHTNANQGTNSAQCVGNIYDILVTNIFPNGIGQGAVKINSSTGQTANAITVRTVHGTYTGAISFASQQSNITDILFEDIDVISPAASGVNLCYINCPNATLGTLIFKNVALRSYAFSTAINMFQVAAGTNLGTLVLENLSWEAGTTNNASNVLQLLASSGSTTTVNNILISKVTGQNTAAAWSNLVLAQQYSTIDTLTIKDVAALTTQAGNFPLFNAQGAVQSVILDGIYLNGGGELVDTATTASAMQIIASNIVSYAMHRLFKVSSTAQCDIMLTNVNVNTLNQAGMINVGGTGAIITVRGSGLINPSNVALFNGSTPTVPARVVHQDMRVDVATIATNLGDRAWNTNAASAILGPVMYDGTKWDATYMILDATAGDITMNGTQAAGAVGKAADSGHVHPSDTSRAALAGASFTGYVAPGANTLTFVGGGTTLVNAALGNVFNLTLTASTTTLGNPSNPVDGQVIRFRITQGSGGNFTMAWGTAYSFGPGGSAPTLSTAAAALDVIAFEYESASSLWRFVGSTIAIANPVPIGNGGTGQTTQQAAINALAGATTSGSYLRGNGTNVQMSAIQAADLPAATTSTQGAVIVDGTATDIQAASTQAAGASTKAAAANHVHPENFPWTAADSGLLWQNMDPASVASSTIMTAGTLYLFRVNARTAFTITNILFYCNTIGAGASSGSFVGMYNSSGTLLTGSSDIGGGLLATGSKTFALTTPQALAAGSFYWVALLVNLATTQPTLARAAVVSMGVPNINLSTSTYRAAVNGTGLVALPGTITPSSNTLSGANFYYMAAN